MTGGATYGISVWLRAEGVSSTFEGTWVKLEWIADDGRALEKQFVPLAESEGNWVRAAARLEAPEGAVSARIELGLAEGGRALFDEVVITQVPPVKHRIVRLGTVCYIPDETDGPDDNRRQYAKQAAIAGEQGADIVCLPEGITVVSTGKTYVEVSEPVPGPSTQVLGEVAREHGMYIVAGVYERESQAVYNTAVLIDREGNLAGKYRKTHLPEAEVRGGITSGDDYPVFETDFGRVGIQICYDNFFPEVARALAVNGAEVIFLPIWGDGRGEPETHTAVYQARAIDNAVFLVVSNYSQKRSLIVDRWGSLIADTGGEFGVEVVEVDLDARRLEPWLSVGSHGEWQKLYQNERRPSTYDTLGSDAAP